MSYQWGQGGPAFEYPTCWRTENRFLTLRAAALVVLAVVVFWLTLGEPDSLRVARLGYSKPLGSSVPHVLMACLYLVLAGLDLWTATRQRRLMLVPRQPASLVAELGRQARGSSPGAAWLLGIIGSGQVPPVALRGPYRRLLAALAPKLAHAPVGLQDFLSERLAHLLFGLGLSVVMVLSWLFIAQPATLALAALLFAALAAGLVARSRWIVKAAPSPAAVGAALLLAALIGLALAALARALPQATQLNDLALPVALAALLLCLVVIEGLGLLAGRAGTEAPATLATGGGDAQADIACDPERLMQEIERELHRYWSEGIPNRRHAWQPAMTDGDGFSLTALEESQPLLSADQREGIPSPRGLRHSALLLLGLLGLLLTVVGGALWVHLAHAHLQDADASLAAAALSLVLVVAGGYAIRVGHLLWSRVEVESALLLLESRSVPAAGGGTWNRLRWTVLRARSTFYVAAGHEPGSRCLLSLRADEAAARRSVHQVQAYAQRALADDRPPAASAAAARVPAPSAPAPSAPRAPAATMFCAACGTAATAQARFCQRCGAELR